MSWTRKTDAETHVDALDSASFFVKEQADRIKELESLVEDKDATISSLEDQIIELTERLSEDHE